MSNGDSRPRRRRRDEHSSPSANILDRQPPCDVSAEMAVLGGILLKPDICDDLALILHSEDFYDDANRKLFAHMADMAERGQRIDITLLVNRLKSAEDYESIGGSAYLARLANSVPNAAHAVYYAEIVRQKSTLRRLIDTGTNILKDAYDEATDPKELLERAERQVLSIQETRTSQTAESMKSLLEKAMERIDARMKGEHVIGGVDSHFSGYDEQCGGFHNGELLILAARPSMGKTALALNMAENVALLSRKPVLFVSLEMTGGELADRLLCSVARVNGHKLRTGNLSQEERQRLVRKALEISNYPLFVDDSPGRTVGEISAVARRIKKREKSLGLIVIDYLQLIEPDNPKDPRQEQVAKIARRLKGMARSEEVPVLCLSQLNRQAEEGKDHRPRMSQLRESGSIEQDADVVMFVHREEYYHRGDDALQYAGQAELIIAKQRNGPVGEIELTWEKDYTRFSDRAPKSHSEYDSSPQITTPGGF
ncbi:MAG TPA: replicative DNA helicase [Planctomycetaceae bacterium]|nr:replicative DNA helicase [Planctomycetaceae bacterium]